MSDSSEQWDEGAAGQADNSPAVQRQAPGVRGAHQIPVEGVTLATGDMIGGKFEVSRYLGSSDGAVSYLCRDTKRDRDSVVKVIDLAHVPKPCQKALAGEVPTAARIQHEHLTSLYGMGQVDPRHVFVAMEFIKGASLARVVSQRREHRKRLNLRDVFTVVAHLEKALAAVHDAGLIHGVITPYNVMITRHGEFKLSNLAFGRATAAALVSQQKGPFLDSIYVAPELAHEPLRNERSADIYSAAMLTVELLSESGLPNNRKEAKSAVSAALSGYPPALSQLLLRALDNDPAARPESMSEIVSVLGAVAKERGIPLGNPPQEGELPLLPAVAPDKPVSSGDDDLFDIPELKQGGESLGGASGGIIFEDEDDEDGRYLVQKGGLDYGPFTYDQVLEQLHRDEIDEDTQVLDRISQERCRLEEVNAFKGAVAEYIPQREERRRIQAEQRAELQRKVKKGGVAVFVVGIVIGLFVLGGMLYIVFTQPDPEPLPMDRAFASLNFKLLPPPKDFTTVAVDKGVMQSIFNPEASEEEIAKQIKKIRRKGRASKGKGGRVKSAGGGDDENVTNVDMSSGSGNGKILSDEEVNEVILGQWGSLRRCVMKEFQSNPNFKGVTVKFFIRPSGTTGGVKIKESQYADKAVGSCLVSRFRAMRFPEHSGFNKGVVFPLRVQ